jgi:hypothetical protein
MALMLDQLKPDRLTRRNDNILRLAANTYYRIAAAGTVLVARDQNGPVITPERSITFWTRRIAGFAIDSELLAAQNRVLWIAGKMTPLARTQLKANGWSLREGPILHGDGIGSTL